MPIDDLLKIMERLRDPLTGCEWDLAQSYQTIAPYTIEEAYEVVDAIERADIGALRDELGDLLLQVVFHAQMAKEAGDFSFDDVVRAICDKLIRRHPHIFTPAGRISASDTTKAWEDAKQKERVARGATSVLDDVPLALPALTRADKIARRAARIGFDWPDVNGPREKIAEELAEVEEAMGRGDADDIASEVGDLLFAVVSYARHLGVDPESALRGSTRRFESRFRYVESRAQQALETVELETLEQWWQEAKVDERRGR